MNTDANTAKKTAGKDKSTQKIDKEGYLYMAPEDGKALKKYYVVYIITYRCLLFKPLFNQISYFHRY